MVAVIINTMAIIIGTLLGRYIIPQLQERYHETIIKAIGLSVLTIGISMSLVEKDLFITLISVILGGVVGETMQLHQRLEKWTGGEEGNGLVTALSLFLVGPMAILGPIAAGLEKNFNLLYIKSILDGITSLILGNTYGLKVIWSAIAVFLYEGSFALAATWVGRMFTPSYQTVVSGVGGVLITGLGLNLLGMQNIRVMNLIFALLIGVLLIGIKLHFHLPI